jgi:hypothetical protein
VRGIAERRRNGKSVVVTINDRGPFVRGRVVDLTPAAARAIAGVRFMTPMPGAGAVVASERKDCAEKSKV